jgi:Zn-dependent protease with chaperone function
MWSTVQGIWFDARSSKANAATLSLNGETVTVRFAERAESARLAEVDVTPRLGDTPRRLNFPGGGMFETPANDAIDRILESTDAGHAGWLHWLEERWRLGVLMVLPVAALLWFTATAGVPALAKAVASLLPDSVTAELAEQVTGRREHFGFEETQLSERERAFLTQAFRRLTAQMNLGADCELRFYKSASVGPNAFALPGCIVVFTDELMMLAQGDDELLAVLVHELGHVRHRHALRHVVQGALLSFILVAITGDATQISAAVASVPLIFLELQFSREFEREADRFAYTAMRAEHIPLQAFPDILLRMEEYWRARSPGTHADGTTDWSRYLATHPPSEERARLFQGP